MANAELEKQENKVAGLRKKVKDVKEELSQKAKDIKERWRAYNASQPTIELTSMGVAATTHAALGLGIDKIGSKIGTKWQPLLDAVPLVLGGVGYGFGSSGGDLNPSGLTRFGVAFSKDVATIALFKVEYGLLKMAVNARAQNALMAVELAQLQAAQQQSAGGNGQQPSQ